jgi:hypothetical protein
MHNKLSLFIGLIFSLFASQLRAQDHIFLRNDEGTLECFILEANDSLIVFRTLDPNDKQEYEIAVSEIYGFLLENPEMLQTTANVQKTWQLEFRNSGKRRKPTFREGNSILFKLIGDTLEMPRSAKITDIQPDSIQLEVRRKRVPERITYGFNQFASFGYRTPLTEVVTLIVAPVSALQDGSFFLYRKLLLEEGWTFEVLEGKQASRIPFVRKYPRRARKVKLPVQVRLRGKRKLKED